MTYQKHINHITICLISMFSWGFHNLLSLTAQDTTATPVPTEVQHKSLFPDDPCDPPCWFGLIPGESRAEEVVDFFAINERAHFVAAYENGEFIHTQDGDIPVIEDGFYTFVFSPDEAYVIRSVNSKVNINNGTIANMMIDIIQIVTYEDAIQRLGTPDAIHMGHYEFTRSGTYPLFFTFIYADGRMRVGFTTDFDINYAVLCDYESLASTLQATGAVYYSLQTANQLQEVSVFDGVNWDKTVYLPTLFAYIPEERYFPEELWGMILGTEPSRSITCEDVWETLPEERILPDSWEDIETPSQ